MSDVRLFLSPEHLEAMAGLPAGPISVWLWVGEQKNVGRRGSQPEERLVAEQPGHQLVSTKFQVRVALGEFNSQRPKITTIV